MDAANVLQNAVEKLEAGTIKKRAEGLDDLRRSLQSLHQSFKLQRLDDFGWEKILTVLFGALKSDKNDLLSVSATAKTRAANRLDNDASALRLIVTTSASYFSPKIAYYVLENIASQLKHTGSNEDPNFRYAQTQFVKCFQIVLARQSSCEHLNATQWLHLTDFVLDAIRANLASLDDVDDDDFDDTARASSVNGSSKSSLPVRPSQSIGDRGLASQAYQIMDDLIVSLQSLVNASNSPLHLRLEKIAETVLSTLTTALQAKDAALECLNAVLMVARTEDTFLLARVAAQLLLLMRKLWTHKIDDKSAKLREQILIALLLIQPILDASQFQSSSIDVGNIDVAAKFLLDEYDNRSNQHCLHLSDLRLFKAQQDTFFNRFGVGPVLESASATANWTALAVIALLRSYVHTGNSSPTSNGTHERPSKRKRLTAAFPDRVRFLFLDEARIDAEDVVLFLNDAMGSLQDDTDEQSSWSLVVAGRLCRLSVARHEKVMQCWPVVWRAASQVLTHTSTARAACFCMHALLSSGLVDHFLNSKGLIESCFHGGSRGPPNLTDAALMLMATCLRSPQLSNERAFAEFRNHALSWLNKVWNLPPGHDYSALLNMAEMASSAHLYDLAVALEGRPQIKLRPQQVNSPSAIYTQHMRMSSSSSFLEFRLGLQSTSDKATPQYRVVQPTVPTTRDVEQSTAVTDFLLQKVDDLMLGFREIEYADCGDLAPRLMLAKRKANVSIGLALILCNACIAICLAISENTIQLNETTISNAWQYILNYTKLQFGDELAFEKAISQIASSLLTIQPEAEDQARVFAGRRNKYVKSLLELVMSYSSNQIELVEVDFELTTQSLSSQHSQNRSQAPVDDVSSRRDLSRSSNVHGEFIRARVSLLKESLNPTDSDVQALSTSMTETLLALPAVDLLASREIFLDWIDRADFLGLSDLSRLMVHLGEVILGVEEYERHEAALCFCLKILCKTIYYWAHTEDEALDDAAFSIYSWFVQIAVKENLLSSQVLYHLTALLGKVIRIKPRYGAEDIQSSRTSLLTILKAGTAGLRFNMAESLKHLFEGYTLTEHAAIFDDLVDCLPTDPEDIEGIAVRLYIIAQVGSRWGTVLRQAVWNIFETAANVSACTPVAMSAVKIIASRIGWDGRPRMIFKIFAPQLFFIWLQDGALETIPFAVFGFDSLKELVDISEQELVPQLVLNMNIRHQKLVAEMLQLSWRDLVLRNFPKSVVYAVTTDVVEYRADGSTGPREKSLRDQVGEADYSAHCKAYFPEIVVQVVLSLDGEKGMEKAWASVKGQKSLAETYATVCAISSSNIVYPHRQQPSFRPKYLMPLLSKFCQLADATEAFLSPALLTRLYRKLFDDAQSPLGPLHSASLVRIIRMIVVLGGAISLRGYPLEMLLHNLRPFLTRFYCAPDVLGVYRYLFDNGRNYLATRLSFLIGIAAAIFASLSEFISQPRESTTQDSHYQNTMSGAQGFRTWLATYLESFDLGGLSKDCAENFRKIVSNATEIRAFGSNNLEDPEGVLLHHLILDQATTKPLMPKHYFVFLLRTMSKNFRLSTGTNQILSQQHELLQCAKVIRSSLNYLVQGNASFRAWIGIVLGRASSSVGPAIVRNDARIENEEQIHNSVTTETSQQLIFEALVRLTYGNHLKTASIAEQSVSLILSTISRTERKTLLRDKPHLANLQDVAFDYAKSSELWLDCNTEMSKLMQKELHPAMHEEEWATVLASRLVNFDVGNSFLTCLRQAIISCNGFAATILPYLAHLALRWQKDHTTTLAGDVLSSTFATILDTQSQTSAEIAKLTVKTILYLRRAPIPRETNLAARNSWIEIDYMQAARCALKYLSSETSLLLLEIAMSEQDLHNAHTRRSSILETTLDRTLESDIFRSVSDRDFFYAAQKDHDVSSVVRRLKHESKGPQVLAYESAIFGARLKLDGMHNALHGSANSVISALALANMNGLARIVQEHPSSHSFSNDSGKQHSQDLSANVHEWDVGLDSSSVHTRASLSQVLTAIQTADSSASILNLVQTGLSQTVAGLLSHEFPQNVNHLSTVITTLMTLADIQQMVSVTSKDELQSVWALLNATSSWYKSESFDQISAVVSAREASATAMRKNEKSLQIFDSTKPELLIHEIRAVRASLRAGKDHDAVQFCLNRAAYLSDLRQIAVREDVDADNVITFDIANTLWSQGEIAAPIEMLQSLMSSKAVGRGVLTVSKAELLSELGQKLSQARQDRPDEVTNRYLRPAIAVLHKDTTGQIAGRVYHNFAAHCDKQLQDSAEKDEFDRVARIRNRRLNEVEELSLMLRNAPRSDREALASHHSKAKKWFKLDDDEYKRLKANRDELLRNALENYLLSLRACDDYKEDVLRLMSLWLGNAENDVASKTVRDTLKYLPSMKLAPFVQQLSSRLLCSDSYFQKGLQEMLFRIWCDHPLQTQYQLFASCKNKAVGNDPIAQSRVKAALVIAERVRSKGGKTSSVWVAIHNSAMHYVLFAQEQLTEKDKSGSKLQFKKFKSALKLQESMQTHYKIPPPVMDVALRADKNYDSVPGWIAFEPQVAVAGGISAPKILAVLASDGSRHKMLLKGGNDDLRQDAIMEQVFAQVSELLQDYHATRQRNLGIRTYKVIPLMHNAGIIEFVQNTIPLHDYLLPAHARYYPKDWKPTQCRKVILDAERIDKTNLKNRLAVYRQATQHFHPVMRFFFMENFFDPQEWFQKRLNYSRSTAAISMLGHVLGLGDRHGHNVLLDERSGEAVHIDLGVAFEAGRILPVPEVVPFRMTRDIVDGMGISGVEGPFRRCCQFTMEALRRSESAIMTILDVLRWDPLYNWVTSPVRMQRIQAQQEREAETAGEEDEIDEPARVSLNKPDEAAEAERALNVVKKKLAATLSVEAMVNELIREATDEKNLSAMYAGWAAYI